MSAIDVDQLLDELVTESQTICIDQWWPGYEALATAGYNTHEREPFATFMDQIDGTRMERGQQSRPDPEALRAALDRLTKSVRYQVAREFVKYRKFVTTRRGLPYWTSAHEHPSFHSCASDPSKPRVAR